VDAEVPEELRQGGNTETALDRGGWLSPEAPSGGFDCRRFQAEQ
jgi:hypothetical protein